LLRRHFQSIFRFLAMLRQVYVNPLLMDRLVRLCDRSPEIKRTFVNILMSQQHPAALLNPAVFGRLLMGA
jgi:hypothetical protein